jgi:cytochrome c oxidase subunit IV
MRPQAHCILAMWRGPVFVWAILVLLTMATFAAAYSSLGIVTKTAIHFAVVAVQVVLIRVFFMNLRTGSRPLLRLAAVAGLYWLAIMFALTFNDYVSRPSSSPCGQPAFSDANAGECESSVSRIDRRWSKAGPPHN